MIFCRAQRTRTIGRTAFQRDLPLFGQAGGYTFRRSGTHRIHVELELPNHSVLRSNILEVRVKPDALSDPTWNAGRNLQNKRIGKLLFHKNDLRDGKGLRLLDEWLNNHSQNKLGSIGTVQYLWSAVALRRSTRKTSEAGKHLREMALERLRRAEQSSGLGDHRRRRIRDLFAEYERPIFRSAPRSSRKTRRTRISHRRS